MKKILILFASLLLVFIGVWVTKSKTPAVRPDSYANGLTESWAWYNHPDDTEEPTEAAWHLDPEIPANYIPVPGEDELYMVVDENGNIIKYRHRTKQADGSWVWEDVNPDIPENYEPVEGLEDVYKVTYEDGSVKYFKYVRNADDTFAFVEVDENGNPIGYDEPEGSEIPDNYEQVTDNVYAVKDENDVVIGYRERSVDDLGNYSWQFVNEPLELSAQIGSPSVTTNITVNLPPEQIVVSDNQKPDVLYVPVDTSSPGIERTEASDGSYTETETLYETVNENGFDVTYVTKITRYYNVNGELLSTNKEGPYPESRVADSSFVTPSDPGIIADTLQAEYARASVGVSFDTSMQSEILAKMNTERASYGLGPLSLDTSGDAAILAATRAAEMASTGYSSLSGTTYGSLADMCLKYDILCNSPMENTWKTDEGTNANAINTMFMADSTTSGAMLSSEHTCVGIGIAYKDGNMYISEVFIN